MGETCHNVTHIHTLSQMHQMFYANPRSIISYKYKHDFASAFYWSYLAYDKQYLRVLFDKSKVSYKLNMYTGTNNTPFTYVLRDVSIKPQVVIIAMRGTNKILRDGMSLIKIIEPLKTKLLDVAFQTLSKNGIKIEPQLILEHATKVHATMHQGIHNHSLKILCSLLDSLYITDLSKHIHVHGHSLGAACASVCATYLKIIGFKNVYCTCLACPRVFEEACPVYWQQRISFQHYFTEQDIVMNLTYWKPGLRSKLRFPLEDHVKRQQRNVSLPSVTMVKDNMVDNTVRHIMYNIPSKYIPSMVKRGVSHHVFTDRDNPNVRLCHMDGRWRNKDDISASKTEIFHKEQIINSI